LKTAWNRETHISVTPKSFEGLAAGIRTCKSLMRLLGAQRPTTSDHACTKERRVLDIRIWGVVGEVRLRAKGKAVYIHVKEYLRPKESRFGCLQDEVSNL
jgi:hypothetical protein